VLPFEGLVFVVRQTKKLILEFGVGVDEETHQGCSTGIGDDFVGVSEIVVEDPWCQVD
jgi:hypothetical protein